jgi:hypothetical protein
MAGRLRGTLLASLSYTPNLNFFTRVACKNQRLSRADCGGITPGRQSFGAIGKRKASGMPAVGEGGRKIVLNEYKGRLSDIGKPSEKAESIIFHNISVGFQTIFF